MPIATPHRAITADFAMTPTAKRAKYVTDRIKHRHGRFPHILDAARCYGPPALYTFPTPYAFPASTYLMPLNPLPYLVDVPLFKSPHLTLIT